MDGNHCAETLTGEVAPLNLDGHGNSYFDYPQTATRHSRVHVEATQIDPSLTTMMDPARTSGQTVITVPENLAEISSKVLIYLAQTVDIPETPKDVDQGPISERTFNTAEEMEILEPIAEGSPEPPIPNMIDGVCVNENPMPADIKDIIDVRRIGSSRKNFYLAKSVDGVYYWFPSRRTYRDRRLHKSIRAYRRKSRAEAARKKKRVQKLRSGKTIRI
jgi:hypothetical protein